MDTRVKSFSDFQKIDFLTDVKIKLSNGSINAHKLVLAANSEFFKILFSNISYKEVTSGVVDLPCIEYETFSFILDYIYFRSNDSYLIKDISFYIDVIAASDFLGMLDFIVYLDLKLANYFNETYLNNFDRIVCYNLPKTVRKCEKNMIELMKKNEYAKLITMPTETLLKLIESDGFAIDENVLFEFISKFLLTNTKLICGNDLKKLIRNIRLSLLDDKHILYYKDLLNKLEFDITDNREILSKPRCVSFLYIVNRSNNVIINIDKVDLVDSSLTESVSAVSLGCNICRIDNHHLVLLKDHVHSDDSVGTLINLATATSITLGSLQYHLPDIDTYRQYGGFSVLLTNSNLFIMGGFYFTHENVTIASKIIIKYDLLGKTWQVTQGVSLKEPCWSHAVAVDFNRQNIIYVSGGRNQEKYLTTFYYIEFSSGVIVDLPPLPKETYGHRMECHKSIVAVFDGNHKNEIFIFDLVHSLWRIIDCSMSGSHLHFSYCFSDDHERNNNTVTLFELTRNFHKNKDSVYKRTIDLNHLEKLIDNQPAMLFVTLKDHHASDLYLGRSVYGSDIVRVTSSEVFDTTYDSD